MMISSNSGTDFISVMRAAGQDPATLFVTEEFRTWLVDYLSENELNKPVIREIISNEENRKILNSKKNNFP